VADKVQLKAGEPYNAALRLRLDLTQLPKPFQVTAIGNKDWNITAEVKRWSFTPAAGRRCKMRALLIIAAAGGHPAVPADVRNGQHGALRRPVPAAARRHRGVAVTLLGLVLWQLRQLWREHRAEVFGSRLKLRLMLMFALMAVVPGVLVYAVSLQFAVKSIESWFDVRVDKALEGGLNLGRNALDYLLADLSEKAARWRSTSAMRRAPRARRN
jgi:hypothetical protein